uniref:Ig-like domain-containing protein n=1 Tax=Oreochromis niloticus TaxID=8128 RepID=A0A669ETW1_ORENI
MAPVTEEDETLSSDQLQYQHVLISSAAAGVKCEQLTQPASVTVHPGDRLTITCQASYSLSSARTFWIRQPAGKELEPLHWLGYTSKTIYASSVQGRSEITRDNSNSMMHLSLSNLKPEDSAVYYCLKENPSLNSSNMKPPEEEYFRGPRTLQPIVCLSLVLSIFLLFVYISHVCYLFLLSYYLYFIPAQLVWSTILLYMYNDNKGLFYSFL